jgi:hypothetical protein
MGIAQNETPFAQRGKRKGGFSANQAGNARQIREDLPDWDVRDYLAL